MELNTCLKEFGPAKVFEQSTKVHKTEHLVLSRMPFCRKTLRKYLGFELDHFY